MKDLFAISYLFLSTPKFSQDRQTNKTLLILSNNESITY